MVLRPSKRARVAEPYYVDRFGIGGYPVAFQGPFRSNLRDFLAEHAQPVLPHDIPGVHQEWCIPFVVESKGVTFNMFVFEELAMESETVYCDNCRMLGWHNNPVCRARYHFIVPACETLDNFFCFGCENTVTLGQSCLGCNTVAPTSILEVQTHLLHGVLHSNGFGHLLRLNGREAGSKFLSGSDIMDMWDRTCTMLRARKVSVLDVSRKFGLEYRIIHGIARGSTWYGTWGYTTARGPYGVTDVAYKEALRSLRELFLRDLAALGKPLADTFRRYQRWSRGLVTLKDIVKYLIDHARTLHRKRGLAAPSEATPRVVTPRVSIGNAYSSRWPLHRLEKTFDVLVAALESYGVNTWVPRDRLRGQAFEMVKDCGLLDHSLCSFVGKRIGARIIERRTDASKRFEYRLAHVGYVEPEKEPEKVPEKKVEAPKLSREDKEFAKVRDDLQFIHDEILLGKNAKLRPEIREHCRILLETKQFIKNYRGNLVTEPEEEEPSVVRVQCRVHVVDEVDSREAWGIPVEMLVLPKSATIGELKKEAGNAFREMYHCFSKMCIESIPAWEFERDDKALYLLGLAVPIRFDVSGVERSATRFEKGLDDWRVNCGCGAVDDDGERMVACDTCGVWSHTRCNHIPDTEPVPPQFQCGSCVSDVSSGNDKTIVTS